MVITVSTRNRVASKIARGFESHRLRQIKIPCTARVFPFFLCASTFFGFRFSSFCMPTHTKVCSIIHLTQNENAKKITNRYYSQKMIAFFPFLWYNEVNHHHSGMELYNEKIFDLVSLDAQDRTVHLWRRICHDRASRE